MIKSYNIFFLRQIILFVLIVLIPLFTVLAQTADDYFDKGVAKSEKGDVIGALYDYNKAIELDPNDAEAYGGRGLAKIFLGQKDSGCLDLSKAGELGDSQAYDAIKEYCN